MRNSPAPALVLGHEGISPPGISLAAAVEDFAFSAITGWPSPLGLETGRSLIRPSKCCDLLDVVDERLDGGQVVPPAMTDTGAIGPVVDDVGLE